MMLENIAPATPKNRNNFGIPSVYNVAPAAEIFFISVLDSIIDTSQLLTE